MISSKRLIQRSFKYLHMTTRPGASACRPTHQAGPAGPDLTPRPCILFALVVLGVSAGVAVVLCRRKDIQRPGANMELPAVLTILQLRVDGGWMEGPQ